MGSKFTCILALILISVSTSFSQNIKSLVDTGKNGLITFKRFDVSATSTITGNEQDFLRKTLKMRASDSLKPMFSKVEGNYTHIHQQYYHGTKVIGGQYSTHSLNGQIESMNGFFKKTDNIYISPAISVENALSNALSLINADKYGWEVAFTDSMYKEQSADHLATLKPKGELVLIYEEANTKSYLLAYKFQIYAV